MALQRSHHSPRDANSGKTFARIAGSSDLSIGPPARMKKLRNPAQRIPATMCTHRSTISSMLPAPEGNATLSFQNAKQTDQIAVMAEKIMSPPPTSVRAAPIGHSMPFRAHLERVNARYVWGLYFEPAG